MKKSERTKEACQWYHFHRHYVSISVLCYHPALLCPISHSSFHLSFLIILLIPITHREMEVGTSRSEGQVMTHPLMGLDLSVSLLLPSPLSSSPFPDAHLATIAMKGSNPRFSVLHHLAHQPLPATSTAHSLHPSHQQ